MGLSEGCLFGVVHEIKPVGIIWTKPKSSWWTLGKKNCDKSCKSHTINVRRKFYLD